MFHDKINESGKLKELSVTQNNCSFFGNSQMTACLMLEKRMCAVN